jgi:hypothetical protein
MENLTSSWGFLQPQDPFQIENGTDLPFCTQFVFFRAHRSSGEAFFEFQRLELVEKLQIDMILITE